MEKAMKISNRVFGIICLTMAGIIFSTMLNQHFMVGHAIIALIMLVMACGLVMLVRLIVNSVIRASFGRE
jgi:hypothetical protein